MSDEELLERLLAAEKRIDQLTTEVHDLRPSAPKAHQYLHIGHKTKIAQGVAISASARRPVVIGDSVVIRRGTEILGPVTIGDNCLISGNGYIRPDTTLGEHVALGPFVRLVTDTHAIGGAKRRAGKFRSGPISVGDGAWLGAGVLVLPGVTIGPGAVIGAGSVVTQDVPAHTVVYGVAASVRKNLEATSNLEAKRRVTPRRLAGRVKRAILRRH